MEQNGFKAGVNFTALVGSSRVESLGGCYADLAAVRAAARRQYDAQDADIST